MNQPLKSLAEYNIWANNRLLNALHVMEQGDFCNSCMRVLSHVLNAQAIWIARITGTESPVKVWQEHTLEECRKLHERTSPKLAELVENADEEELQRRISYTNSQGNAYINQVYDIFIHVFNHATYHRAQVAKEMRQNGLEPVNTDYITYVRENKS